MKCFHTMCEYGFSGEFRIKKHQDIYTDESGLTLDHQVDRGQMSIWTFIDIIL